MKENYRDLLPEDYSPSSRVWIYQASRRFSIPEALQLEKMMGEFVRNWQSHGSPVAGYGNLFFGQFVVLIADESITDVSGCSTDSSVRFIKTLEKEFSVSLFDRQILAFLIKDRIELLPLNQLPYAAANGFLDPETVYFNNLVQTLEELRNKWMIPVKESWLAKKISFGQSIS